MDAVDGEADGLVARRQPRNSQIDLVETRRYQAGKLDGQVHLASDRDRHWIGQRIRLREGLTVGVRGIRRSEAGGKKLDGLAGDSRA